MKEKPEKFQEKLSDLILLGEKILTYFHIEKCDPYPKEYKYLDELPKEDWSDEDKKNKLEYENFLQQLAATHEELKNLGSLSR